MAVRVRVKLKSTAAEIETVALVNTGFETDRPEMVLPVRLAERLGLYPPTKGSTLEEYGVVGGTTLLIRSPQRLSVQVLVADRSTKPVEAVPMISSGEEEVLISDKLASALRLSIEDPGEGVWRFRDDSPGVERASAPPEYWV